MFTYTLYFIDQLDFFRGRPQFRVLSKFKKTKTVQIFIKKKVINYNIKIKYKEVRISELQ